MLIIIAFSSLAIVGIAGTDYLRSNAFTFDEETEHNKRVLWEYLCVFMYAIWASVLTKYIGTAVEYLVRLENHSEQAEEDDSRIAKSFFLSCVISYFGLFYYQYVAGDYGWLCLLMICLQVFN